MRKNAPERRVRDVLFEAVRAKAELAQLQPGASSKSIEDLSWEIWQTEQGKKLYEIYASPAGLLSEKEARASIRKSAQWDDLARALSIADSWRRP